MSNWVIDFNFEFFRLKKEMRQYTAMNPSQRIARLMDFNRRLIGAPDSARTLSEWKLNLDENLVKFKGRKIAPQTICFGDNKV